MENNQDQLHKLRHSTEHVLTQAILNIYGKDKITMAMGPSTEDGFYFDFEAAEGITISEADFKSIEKEMWKIINRNLPITRKEISVDEARTLFAGNSYKQEWLDQIKDRNEAASIYWTGEEFVDLCAGPHLNSTGEIKAFKLLSVAGAYWHGDEKNKMLTRIYGTAFESDEALKEHLARLEEAKKRDHRKLGKELDLFTFSPLIGSGLPLYTPKGASIRIRLNQYVEEVQSKLEFTQVWTPQIAKAELFKTSGHYDKYKNDMFQVISHHSDEEFYLKPMNCPQHTQIYAAKPHSYRDLPIRMTDFAMLYRDEKPGELNGLARVRSFSQDDCHIFCREDQVDFEVDQMLTMTKQIMETFNLKYRYRLSTRDPNHPEKFLGDPKMWDKVEAWAVEIMKRNQIEYFDGPGEAAFYAPKMDLIATDALGREWQLSTVQIDYVMPERFNLTYTATDGTEQRPVMLHRAIIGSPERFIMILIEHFGGAFPVWLSPIQAVVIPISQDQSVASKLVYEQLKEAGIRVELWDQAESMQKRIRLAEKQKTPYMLIIGQTEADAGTVSVRGRGQKDLGIMEPAAFLKKVQDAVTTKSLEL